MIPHHDRFKRIITPEHIIQTKLTPLYESSRWYINLNETLHRFESKPDSEYRIAINKIVDDILKTTPIRTHVSVDGVSYNNVFEFIQPFKMVKHFNIINKLKIYLTDDSDDVDGVCYCDEAYNNLHKTDPSELPLYQKIGSKINVISIAIAVPDLDRNRITHIIAHELKHALFAIKTNQIGRIGEDNKITDELYQYKAPKGYGNIGKFIANCSYYGQQTEIEALLETTAYEIKNISTDNLKTILKIYSTPDKFELSDYDHIMTTTIYNYLYLNDWLERTSNPSFISMLKHSGVYDDVSDILKKHQYHSDTPLEDYLTFWKCQITQFLLKSSSIILDEIYHRENPDKTV